MKQRSTSAAAPTCPLCKRQATGSTYRLREQVIGIWSCNPCREHITEDGRAYVPARTSGCFDGDLYDAAGSYMICGWYVLPVRKVPGKGYRHAGSVLGKNWPEKSTRQMWELRKFLRPTMLDRSGLALHVGGSGMVAFDIDTPANVPRLLRDAIERDQPPFQSTRADDPDRGHYVWRLPEGVMLGNSLGRLRTDPPWGEVRGRNGIIVVEPSVHDKPEGRYRWQRTSRLVELPKDLARALLSTPKVHSGGGHAYHPLYSTRRVDALLTNLRQAQEGERNSVLFWTACRFGELAAEGRIDEAMIRETLIDIADEIGLPSGEATATTDSGLTTGYWAWSG